LDPAGPVVNAPEGVPVDLAQCLVEANRSLDTPPSRPDNAALRPAMKGLRETGYGRSRHGLAAVGVRRAWCLQMVRRRIPGRGDGQLVVHRRRELQPLRAAADEPLFLREDGGEAQ
jgi:hypothetical protein